MDHPFELTQLLHAPPARVWEVLTEEQHMQVWYFPQVQTFRPVAGYRFEFTDDGSSYQKEWIVTKVEPGRTLSHSWVYKGFPGYSEVTFEIAEAASGQTKLMLSHTGLSSFPDDPHFARQRFEDGWKSIVGKLTYYLEDRI